MFNKYKKLILSNTNNDKNVTLLMQLCKEWSLWSKFFGKILVITGPTSSGKTTILLKMLKYVANCKTINRKTVLKQVEITLDRLFFTSIFNKAEIIFGKEIKDRRAFWETSLEELSIQDALELKALKEEFNKIFTSISFVKFFLITTFSLYYEESKKHIFSGHNIILDESFLYGEMSYSIFNYCYNYYPEIKFLLFFNTLEETLEKCMVRNNKFFKFVKDYNHSNSISSALDELEHITGNSISSYRTPTTIMDAYMKFYYFKSAISISDTPLEKIYKQKFQSIISKINDMESRFFQKLKKLEVNLPIKCNFIDPIQKTEMLFDENNYCYIVSKNPYDFFLHAPTIKDLKLLDDVGFLYNFLSKILEWFGHNTKEYKYTNDAKVCISKEGNSLHHFESDQVIVKNDALVTLDSGQPRLEIRDHTHFGQAVLGVGVQSSIEAKRYNKDTKAKCQEDSFNSLLFFQLPKLIKYYDSNNTSHQEEDSGRRHTIAPALIL